MSTNPGKVKELILAFWLAIISMAVLTGCNNNPTARTSPSPASSAKPENVAKAEKTLKSLYREQIGLPIESISCPESASFKDGTTFDCQATAQGVKFAIQVENNQGRFNSKVKGQLLNLTKVEDLLEKTFRERANLDVTADCGGKRRVSKVGDRFICKVKDKQGKVRDAQVTVKDEKGNFKVKI
jgi:hypothetical protein